MCLRAVAVVGFQACSLLTEGEPGPDEISITIGVSPGGGGSVACAPDQSVHAPGDFVTIEVTPAPGFSVVRWAGAPAEYDNPQQISVSDHLVIVAVFAALPEYDLTVAVSPSGSGTITGNPDLVTYTEGLVVELNGRR